MTPTLLEGLVVVVLVGVAWQIGLILAPILRHHWHNQIDALEEASEDEPDEIEAQGRLALKEKRDESQR